MKATAIITLTSSAHVTASPMAVLTQRARRDSRSSRSLSVASPSPAVPSCASMARAR